MTLEPARESGDLRERAQAAWPDVFRLNGRELAENEKMTQRRRNRGRQLQQVYRNRQRHFGETPDFKPTDAEEKPGSELLTEKLEREELAILAPGKSEQKIG